MAVRLGAMVLRERDLRTAIDTNAYASRSHGAAKEGDSEHALNEGEGVTEWHRTLELAHCGSA